jgi:hypothetical protein
LTWDGTSPVYVQRALERPPRLLGIVLPLVNFAGPLVAFGKVALPSGISGVGQGEAHQPAYLVDRAQWLRMSS